MGRSKESWSVDYLVLGGRTAEPAVWQKLSAILEKQYPTQSGITMQISMLAVDSGYATSEVYAWARQQMASRVVVVKGDSRAQSSFGHPSAVDIGPRGEPLRGGIRVWPVSGSMVKEELYRWLHLDRPSEENGGSYPPGYCHFPSYSEEYFKQLTAEQLVSRIVRGYRRPEWQKTRDRNEALDCRVYARAAAAIVGMDRLSEAEW